MAVGDGAIVSDERAVALEGERWLATSDFTGKYWRVPGSRTLDALIERYQAFVERIHYSHHLRTGYFTDLPPLKESAFRIVTYRRATDPSGRKWVAFRIASVDPDEPNPSFNTARRCRDVADWVRSATATVCHDWPFGDTVSFVHGHAPNGGQLKGDHADDRFMYLPLPSIERRGDRGQHVGSIRRVLIAAPPEFADRVEWVRRRLPGQDLIDAERGTVGVLNLLPISDWVLRQYTNAAQVWSTVTPVVLPGYDDRKRLRRKMNDVKNAANRRRWHEELDTRVEGLLRTAILQAGFPAVLAENAELFWRLVGFRAGLALATEYTVPDYLQGRPRYHVRICWRDASRAAVNVSGPVVIGAGRHRGLGLFAAEES